MMKSLILICTFILLGQNSQAETSCLPKVDAAIDYIEAVASNIANIHTVSGNGEPYLKKMRICKESSCEIIELASVIKPMFLPEHPAAVSGIVRVPNIDIDYEIREMITVSKEYDAAFESCNREDRGQVIEAHIERLFRDGPYNPIIVL